MAGETRVSPGQRGACAGTEPPLAARFPAAQEPAARLLGVRGACALWTLSLDARLTWPGPRQRPLLGLRLGVHLGSPGAGLQGKALIRAERTPRFHPRPSEARSPDPPKNRRLFSVESQKSALGFSVCPREGERVGGARPAGVLQEHPDLSPRPRNMCLLEGPGRLLVFLISETGDWKLALSVNSLARKWYWPTDLESGTNSRSREPHQKVTSIPSAWGRGRK